MSEVVLLEDVIDQEAIVPNGISMLSNRLMNQQVWKERKGALEELLQNLNNPDFRAVFMQNAESLLQDTNMLCLQLALQLLQVHVNQIPVAYLPQITSVLINQLLQNQKTSVRDNASQVLSAILGSHPIVVVTTLLQSLDSKNVKQIKSCLQYLEHLGANNAPYLLQVHGADIAAPLLPLLQHKDSSIKKQAFDVLAVILDKCVDLQGQIIEYFEQNLPKQLFQQILSLLISSGEVEEQNMLILSQKLDKSISPKQQAEPRSQVHQSPKRPYSQPHQQFGDKSEVGIDRAVVMQQVYELSQFQSLGWKEKKAILDKFMDEFASASQVSGDILRQLKICLEQETNTVVVNLIIKLQTLILTNTMTKLGKMTLTSILTKIKDKKCTAAVQLALASAFIRNIKLQDLIEPDILILLNNKDTRQEIAVILKHFFSGEESIGLNQDQNIQVFKNSVITNQQLFNKLLNTLLIASSDPNQTTRQIICDCLTSFCKVHMCSQAYVHEIWELIFQPVVVNMQQPSNVNQLIQNLLVCSSNFKLSNQQDVKRLIMIAQSIANLITFAKIPADTFQLHRCLGYPTFIIETLDSIMGKPEEFLDAVAVPTYSKVGPNDYNKQILDIQDIYGNDRGNASRGNKPRSPIQQIATYRPPQQQNRANEKQQLLSDYNPVSPINIEQMFAEQIPFLTSQDKQQQFQASTFIQQEIGSLVVKYQNQMDQFFEGAFDFLIKYFAEADQQLFIDGVRIMVILIKQFGEAFNPLTLLKPLDIFIYRINEPKIIKHIQDYIIAITSVYGFQLPITFIQKYISENFVSQELVLIFIEVIKKFGFRCGTIGLDFAKHVLLSQVSEQQCNISQIFNYLLSNLESDPIIPQLMSYVVSGLLVPEQQTQLLQLFPNLSDIQPVQLSPTDVVMFPLGQKPQTKTPSPVVPKASSPVREVSRIPAIQPAFQSPAKSQQANRPISQAPAYQPPASASAVLKSSPPKLTFDLILKPQRSQAAVEYSRSSFELPQLFLDYTNQLLIFCVGSSEQQRPSLRSERLQLACERLCYQCVEIFNFDETLLNSCFLDGFLRISSSVEKIAVLIGQLSQFAKTTTDAVVVDVITRFCVVCLCMMVENLMDYSNYQEIFGLIIRTMLNLKDMYSLQLLLPLMIRFLTVLDYVEKFYHHDEHVDLIINVIQYFGSVVGNIQYCKAINNELLMLQMIDSKNLDIKHDLQLIQVYIQGFEPCIEQMEIMQSLLLLHTYNNRKIMIQQIVHEMVIKLQQLLPLQQVLQQLQLTDKTLVGELQEAFQPKQAVMIQYINNMYNQDLEVYITAMKQAILYIRDDANRYHAHQDNVQIINTVISNLDKYITQFIQSNYLLFNQRLLKYSFLLVIELVQDKSATKFVEKLTNKLIVLSYYFAFQHHLELQIPEAKAKMVEIIENATLLLQKIIQNQTPAMLFVKFLHLMQDIYQLFNQKQQINDSIVQSLCANFQTLNGLQTQVLVKNLLKSHNLLTPQEVLEAKYESAVMFESEVGQILQRFKLKNEPDCIYNVLQSSPEQPQLISSYVNYLQQQEIQTKIVAKDLKLFLRFLRTFNENTAAALIKVDENQFPVYVVLLISMDTLTGSLVGQTKIQTQTQPTNLSVIQVQQKQQMSAIQAKQVQEPQQEPLNPELLQNFAQCMNDFVQNPKGCARYLHGLFQIHFKQQELAIDQYRQRIAPVWSQLVQTTGLPMGLAEKALGVLIQVQRGWLAAAEEERKLDVVIAGFFGK